MKRLFILAVATILSSNTYALETATNSLAYTLANTLYTTAAGIMTTEASTLAISSKNQKAEARKIQNDAQNYYMSGMASIFLESKIQIAKELQAGLSEEEAVDLLVEASQIILDQ